MADQKISQLTTITTVDIAADLFPIVDTSESQTKKITPTALKTALALNNVDNTSDLNKPISNATQTALDGKVDENSAITGATKTKITYDAKGLVTSGADATTADIADSTDKRYVSDAQLVVIGNTSGTNTGDNATNNQYSGLATSKQDTLVSGTNIKTINSTSLLGSGDIAISASPSGVAGAIQFSDGSAFSSDATNLFWDNTNNRLGIGTNAPQNSLHVTTASRLSNLIFGSFSNTSITNTLGTSNINFASGGIGISGETALTPTARLHILGAGATSATTSLLVQNSAGTDLFKIADNGNVTMSTTGTSNNMNGTYNFISNVSLRAVNDSGSTALNLRFVVSGASRSLLINSDYTNINDPSALVEIQSTTKGFLPPKMTTTQKNAITSPASGLVVYDTTTNKLCCYNGTSWIDLF